MKLTDEELREAQLLMLNILSDVHDLCKKNNINYFLSDGTLIGAVRHNGFIPWDDDIDIGMLRKDYEKFIDAVAVDESFNKKYFFQCDETDEYYPSQYGKVRLKGTKWIESMTTTVDSLNDGLYIDIFPYDVVSKNKIKKNIRCMRVRLITTLLYLKCKYKITSNSFIKNLFFKILAKIVKRMDKNKLCNRRKQICVFDNKHDNGNYGVTRFSNKNFRVIDDIDDYSLLELHKFENKEFFIPVKFDKVLTNYFGDYMTPPPLNKIHKHEIIGYSFGIYKKN